LGVHPGVASSRAAYDPDSFRQLLPQFALIGEVGLDKRGPRDEQERILADVLEACTGWPVFISIHSTGRTSEVVELVGRYPHPGIILHWFLGTPDEVNRAVALGAYFSVNDAMSDALLIAIPRHRVLPETDFPARQVRAGLPGETRPLESRLARIWGLSENEVRHLVWVNLKQLAMASGAIDSVSDVLADALLIV
jgi:TatD DNase family protein